MKRVIYVISALFLFCFLACDRKELFSEGEGALKLNVVIENSVNVSVTRGLDEEKQLRLQEECEVRLYSPNGLVQYYKGLEQLPEEILLKAGDYTVVVTAGDSVAVSYDQVYYKGIKPISLIAGESMPVDIVATIFNTVVSIDFDATLQHAFSDYKVTVSSSDGDLLFTPTSESLMGYFIVTDEKAILEYHFQGTSLQGESYTKSDAISVEPSTQYDFRFSYNDDDYCGGAGELLSVDVITTPLEEKEDTVSVINQKPTFHGAFEENPYYLRIGDEEDIELWIAATAPLKNVIISCNRFTEWNLPAVFDLFLLKDNEKVELEDKGLSSYYKYNFINNNSNLRIILDKSLVAKMTIAESEMDISFSVTDENGRSRLETLKIQVMDENVTTSPMQRVDIWGTKATLRGRVIYNPEERVYFRYRVAGSEYNWLEQDAEIHGDEISAEITGLQVNTMYEYQLREGDKSSTLYTFTTDGPQLPNSGFENWSEIGGVWYLYDSEKESMFWDSGNKGSYSGRVNVTTSDKSVFVEGEKSVMMKSQVVAIKFAAGNLFSGQYLELVGMNGAKLDFGRPFTYRPSKLRFWYRYISTEIKYDDSKLTEELKAEGAVKGQMDKACVYIALGDWGSPVRVDNSLRPNGLFDKYDDNVIAYGEFVESNTTEGTGMHMHEIELDYRSFTRIPTHIVIVGTSSKYGDYFTGGAGSTLWLDNLELVYE